MAVLWARPVAAEARFTFARSRANAALKLAAHAGYGIGAVWAGWSLAVLSLSERDPSAGHAALAPAVEREGVTESVMVTFQADGVESLVGLGQLLRPLEQSTLPVARLWLCLVM
jgi:hypothetical protein